MREKQRTAGEHPPQELRRRDQWEVREGGGTGLQLPENDLNGGQTLSLPKASCCSCVHSAGIQWSPAARDLSLIKPYQSQPRKGYGWQDATHMDQSAPIPPKSRSLLPVIDNFYLHD